MAENTEFEVCLSNCLSFCGHDCYVFGMQSCQVFSENHLRKNSYPITVNDFNCKFIAENALYGLRIR